MLEKEFRINSGEVLASNESVVAKGEKKLDERVKCLRIVISQIGLL